MDIRIEVNHRISVEDLDALRGLGDTLMSQISDAIAHLSATVDAAIGRVQGDLAALQAQVADGSATPEDLAALAALQAKLDALDPAKPDVLPPTDGATPAGAIPAGATP